MAVDSNWGCKQNEVPSMLQKLFAVGKTLWMFNRCLVAIIRAVIFDALLCADECGGGGLLNCE